MLTNYVYKLCPNVSQSEKMDNWVDLLRSHYNWCLNDRISQYSQQFIQGDYCDIRTRAEACPITCFVSKNGATGEPWKDNKLDKEGNLKNPRRSAGDIQITSLPMLKQARPWYADIDSTVLQQNVKRLDVAYKNFFEGRGFPQFKNRSNFTSFTYTVGTKVQGNKIYLPKIGWMRFHNSRFIPDGFTIKAVTVRKIQAIQSMVRGDSAKPDANISKSNNGTSKRPKQRKEISVRSLSKRAEPGNLCKQDIKTARS